MNPLTASSREGATMPLLMWRKKYSVGVTAMDDQHITLAKILNELHAAMLKGQAQSVADVLLRRLMDYVQEHFSSEEKLMESVKFPDMAAHSAEHRNLTAKAMEYMARYEQGDQTMYPQMLYFVRDWFYDHMQTVDKEYAAWMNEHGVR
jgi:hemerythrin-like metal-binding protein